MDEVAVWIVLNAVTIVATFLLTLVNYRRVSRANAKLLLPAGEDLKLLRDHNYRCAQDDYWLNLFILILGIAMVFWAMTWTEGDVPNGIVWGTGAFTAGWTLWSYRGWQSWKRLDHLTKVVEAKKEADRHAVQG